MNETTLTVRLPISLRKQIKREAKLVGKTDSVLVRIAIEEYLDNLEERRIASRYAADGQKKEQSR
jgi:predicted DNA-binding protein